MSNMSHEIKIDDEIKAAPVVQATLIDLFNAIDESIARLHPGSPPAFRETKKK